MHSRSIWSLQFEGINFTIWASLRLHRRCWCQREVSSFTGKSWGCRSCHKCEQCEVCTVHSAHWTLNTVHRSVCIQCAVQSAVHCIWSIVEWSVLETASCAVHIVHIVHLVWCAVAFEVFQCALQSQLEQNSQLNLISFANKCHGKIEFLGILFQMTWYHSSPNQFRSRSDVSHSLNNGLLMWLWVRILMTMMTVMTLMEMMKICSAKSFMVIKITLWQKFSCDKSYLVIKVREVIIVKEVKISDGLWHFASANVYI